MTNREDGLVPSPRYRALLETLRRVRERVAHLEAGLDEPYAQFTGHAVWVGPVARRFGDELSSYRRRLRTQAEEVIRELEAEIRATPELVSPSVAVEESTEFWPWLRSYDPT